MPDSQINPITHFDFDATQHPSLGPSSVRPWMVREVALAAIALFVIVIASWAICNVGSLSHFTHLNMATVPAWAYKCILAAGVILGFRTFVWRTSVMAIINKYGRKGLYPLEQRESPCGVLRRGCHFEILTRPINLDPSWSEKSSDKQDLTLKAYDGKTIRGCLLKRTDRGENRKGVMILCLGNGELYDKSPVNDPDYNAIRASGYDLVLYHPPGYGSSVGPRTPRSDFLALEAVVLYLNQEKQIPFDSIHLQCRSLGSGAGGAISAEYPLGSVKFVVPLARTEDVAERVVASKTSRFTGKLFQFCVGGVVRDMLGYDNVDAMAHMKAKEVDIEEGEQDSLMTKGPVETEAAKMAKAWLHAFAPSQIIHPIGNEDGEKTERCNVQTEDHHHLIFHTWRAMDHCAVPFPLLV